LLRDAGEDSEAAGILVNDAGIGSQQYLRPLEPSRWMLPGAQKGRQFTTFGGGQFGVQLNQTM
jgi:hypothetical protein